MSGELCFEKVNCTIFDNQQHTGNLQCHEALAQLSVL